MKRKSKPKTPKKPRPSGGRRHTVAIQTARAEARGDAFDKAWFADYEELVGKPPLDDPKAMHGWHAKLLAFALDNCARDPGLPVEARREQIARLSPQLAKALQPAELAAELRDFARALRENNTSPTPTAAQPRVEADA